MVNKTITLTLTVEEEAALARTIDEVCRRINEGDRSLIFIGDDDHIWRINAALNAVR